MKISVVIPCFNNSDFLSETIESVLAQSHEDLECVLIDDGSTDHSQAIASEYQNKDSRVIFQERPKHLPKGANSCRNFGAGLATGSLLLFLDADDVLASKCLEKRLSAYRGEDLLVGQVGIFESHLPDAIPFFKNLNTTEDSEHYLNMFLEYLIPWHTSSGLWKKAFFEAIGGFNLNLQRFQDVELHVRALSQKAVRLKLDFGDGFTSFYRRSNFHQSMTMSKRRFILDEGICYLKELQKFLPSPKLINLQGTLAYLLFRFEEVATPKDISTLLQYTSDDSESNDSLNLSWKVRGLLFIFQSFPSTSRIRKYLSFAFFKLYKDGVVKQYS